MRHCYGFGDHISGLQLRLQIFLHPLPEHGLKRLKYLILIILLQKVGELGYLLAFLAASDHFHTVYLEPNNFVAVAAEPVVIVKPRHNCTETAADMAVPGILPARQLLAAQLVAAFHARAYLLVLQYFADWKWKAADWTRYLILRVNFHYYF